MYVREGLTQCKKIVKSQNIEWGDERRGEHPEGGPEILHLFQAKPLIAMPKTLHGECLAEDRVRRAGSVRSESTGVPCGEDFKGMFPKVGPQ